MHQMETENQNKEKTAQNIKDVEKKDVEEKKNMEVKGEKKE